MIQTSCLTADQLQAYLHGSLPETAGDEIDRHLRSCDRCNDTATRLESNDDSLVRHLRLQPGSLEQETLDQETTDDLEWTACLERLRQLPARDGDASDVAAGTTLQERLEPTAVYHYRLDGVIGRGGMGVVYRGWHPQLHRAVAVKVLSASRADDAASVNRFQREMRAAGSLDHVAIVRALDAGVWHGTYYLAMELVDGIDLSKLVKLQGPLGAGDACALVVQAAEALQYAHAHHVIHRDIKPSNLMLGRDGQLKIFDFGLARLEHAGMADHAATSAGHLIGTLDYLAPEQAGGEQPIDGRADVYGLGATLFKLLSGEPPHGSSAQRPMLDHLQRLTGQAAGRLDQFRDDLPAELVEAVSDMLQRDPVKRIASAADAAARLRPFATDAGLAALAQETLAKVDRSATDASSDHGWSHSPNAAGPASPAKPSATSSRRWVGLIGIVVLILLGTILGAFAGVTIILKTGEGELIVESEVDGITLELIPDGASVPTLQVNAGTTTTIRSGKYQLRIAGASDSVTVEPTRMIVKRGDRRIASVRRKPSTAETAGDAAAWKDQLRLRQEALNARLATQSEKLGKKHPDVMATGRELDVITQLIDGQGNAPTYRGRTYAQWQQIALRETEVITVVHAMDSLVRLSQFDQHDQTMATLFQVAENFNRDIPTALATRDAYIDFNGEEKRRGSSKSKEPSYFAAGPRGWQIVMKQLFVGLAMLPSEIVARQLKARVGGQNESDQLAVIAFVVANARVDKPLVGGAELIDQLAAQDRSELVKAVAMFVQLAVLKVKVSQQHVDQLKRDSPLVAPAVLSGMLRTNQYNAVDEMGRAAATSVFHATSQSASGKEQLITPVLRKQIDGSPSPTREQESAMLGAFGKHLVRGWQETDLREFPGHSSVMLLAGLNLLDNETRRVAEPQLAARITRLLAKRATLTSFAALRDSPSSPKEALSLMQLCKILLHVRGEFPAEVRNLPLDAESGLGNEFARWRQSLAANAEENDGSIWMTWYPLEATEAYLRQAGRVAVSSEMLLGPRRRAISSDLILPEFAVTIAAANVTDVELQSGLAINLQQNAQQPLSWLGLPKYLYLLKTLAQQSAVPAARVASLVLAQRAGLDDEECRRLAFELFGMKLPQLDKENLLLVFSNAAPGDMSPVFFDRLLEVASFQQDRFEPFLQMLKIMEKSEVVTADGLELLRGCLGDQKGKRKIRVPTPPIALFASKTPEEQLLQAAMIARVDANLIRQALVTSRVLGPKARAALPAIEAMLARIQKSTREGAPQFMVELRATIATIQGVPQPQDPTNRDPSSDSPARR